MNKLVYLFELDSVRTTQQEIEKGQNAMFEEIARNGNTVVLSLNQLTDSRAFMAAVENKYTYPHILELFKAGAIRISYYGNKRTPSQYIQEAIEKCNARDRNTFIFSALPVLCTENDLLETIHTALRYSDPSLISELSDEKKQLLETGSGNAEELGQDIERLDFLERYVRMILLLSTERLCGNKPIGEPTTSFSEYMERVLRHYGGSGDELILEAADILRQVGEELSITDGGRNRNNRSAWVNKLYEYEKSDPVCMAEAVCDLCYNFTIEESILTFRGTLTPRTATAFSACSTSGCGITGTTTKRETMFSTRATETTQRRILPVSPTG